MYIVIVILIVTDALGIVIIINIWQPWGFMKLLFPDEGIIIGEGNATSCNG